MPTMSAPSHDNLPAPSSEESERRKLALHGSRALLRAAWVVLLLWILMLGALALHVLKVW
jgi:hypothetical protein